MGLQTKVLIDSLDNLMIALSKQKHLGLDPEVNNALKDVTKARNKLKKEYNDHLARRNKFT